MKKLFGIIIFVFIFALLVSQKLYAYKVIVTIEPQRYFFSKIAGNLAETVVLVPSGANLHTFELKPSQIKEVSGANIYFTIGDPVEISLKNKIKTINKDIKIVDTDKNIKKLPIENHDHDHERHHEHGNLDPHIWLSPELVKIISQNMLQELITCDPKHADIYKKNFDNFISEISALNNEIKEILKSVPKDTAFLVFHPSWGYFAKDYNLIQLSVEYKGREPSPKKLASIIKTSKQKEIKTIFVQPQISSRIAEIIAKEINATVTIADPLAFNWHENLKEIAKKIRDSQ
jgi:zinc transport system substrate-binding protein